MCSTIYMQVNSGLLFVRFKKKADQSNGGLNSFKINSRFSFQFSESKRNSKQENFNSRKTKHKKCKTEIERRKTVTDES